ncbi:MAG: MgtC/SapB family protein [Desertimonas sp.]
MTPDWVLQLHLVGGLALAAALGAAIGVERHYRNKDAGLRTHALVALGAAGFMVVSGYGFSGTAAGGPVDPTRIAAQVVSGIGFLGGGVIFVRRDAVRGLTTASTIWLTAAVGMCAGAQLPVIAAALTALHFVVVSVLPQAARLLPRSGQVVNTVTIAYPNHQGMLRDIMAVLTTAGWHVANFEQYRDEFGADGTTVKVRLDVTGAGTSEELISRLSGFGPHLSLEIGADDDWS